MGINPLVDRFPKGETHQETDVRGSASEGLDGEDAIKGRRGQVDE